MKIIFFGSGKFGIEILGALHRSNHQVSLVVTQPDRKKGRHLRLAATPVKEYAVGNHLKIYQPEDVNGPESIEFLKKETADVFIVVAYGKILSKKILELPRLMPVNIHASLLPKYRGAAPIHWALRKGEKKTGVTFIKMNDKMDQGDIIFQKAIKIVPTDIGPVLEDRLCGLAAGVVLQVIEQIENNKVKLKKQNERQASYAPLLKKQDGWIPWHLSSEEVFNHFRGNFGWPGSFTKFKGRFLKILTMEKGKLNVPGKPGEVVRVEDNALEVVCGRGSILIKEVLPESHHRMSAKDFQTGHHVRTGDVLGA